MTPTMMRRFAFSATFVVAVAASSLPGCADSSTTVEAAAVTPKAEEVGTAADRALALFKVTGTGSADDEIRKVQEQLTRLPKKHDLWILLGQAWVKKARQSSDPGFYLHADAAANIAVALEPGSRAAGNLRGLVLLNNHDFTAARDLAVQLTQKEPGDPVAWGVLSDALLELGDVDGASKAADTMMERKPNLPSYARVSYLKWLRGDVPGAVEAIRLAWDAGRGQKDPEPIAWVLSEAALIFWHNGDVEGALAGCDKALTTMPDHAPTLALKARALLDLKRPAEAKPLAEKSLQLQPLVDTARLVEAIALALGDKEGADAAVARAKGIGEATDARGLALLLADRGEDLPRALSLIDKETGSGGPVKRGGVYTDDVRGQVLFRLGRLDEARAASDRALALGTKDARLLQHAAAIRAAQKDPSAATLAADAARLR